jgi:iron complex outermembrane receptor protein
VSYDLSDSFSIDTGLRYDYSRVDAAKFYLKSRWEERGYAAEFADFIVGEEGNQWLAKPSFTFHNVSASAGFHKEFAADLNWYSNISLAMRNQILLSFLVTVCIILLGLSSWDLALDKEVAVKLSTTVQKNGLISRLR